MKYLGLTSVLLLLIMSVSGCSEEAAPTAALIDASSENPAEAFTLSKDLTIPHVLLGSIDRCAGQAVSCKAHPAQLANGFTSPLFALATAPNGDILVADAGAGVAVADGGTEISLPGITGIGPIGRSSLWATVGASGEDGTSDGGQALYRVSQGRARLIVNLFAFEAANNPDGGIVESNPFDVASLGGGAALVADAAGNDLLRVDNQGNVEVLAVFPNELVSTDNIKALAGCPGSGAPFCFLPPILPAQPVPTSVAVGPDGYYYVGELKGFPAPTGESNIWRVSPDASGALCPNPDCVKVFDGGFTSIIDLAFDADGALHVAELDENSWFSVEIPGSGVGGSISACDLGTLVCGNVAAGIPILTAITFGKDGVLWATENALIPGLAGVTEIP